MINGYSHQDGRLVEIPYSDQALNDLIWIDLVAPNRGEETQLENDLRIGVPTRDEMAEIEISSRLYKEGDAVFMTAILPAHSDDDEPDMQPVSFILTGHHLLTVRYHDPRAFKTFPQRAAKVAMGLNSGESVFIALLEAIVDRMADILERAGRDIDQISRQIFRHRTDEVVEAKSLQVTLETIGRKGDLVSKIIDSLMTLDRLSGFVSQHISGKGDPAGHRVRVKTLTRDIRSITDHAGFLSQKVTFLLDATLGMISIEQNSIIKILSVAAVVFLPPTLIASIYGMNFEHMPELKWLAGYPVTIVIMVLAAILPYLFFKRKGWL